MLRRSPLLLVAVVLLAAGAVSGETLRVGPELQVSTAELGIAVGEQSHPKVAFDGTQYLVVWEDTRSGVSEIRAARVARDGRVIDPVGFRISEELWGGVEPNVACFDGVCLVAWAPGPVARTYYWRTVAADASLSSVGSIALTGYPFNIGLSPPEVVVSSSRFFVYLPAIHAEGAFIRRDGTLETRVDLTTTDKDGGAFGPYDYSAAYDGSRFVLAIGRGTKIELFAIGESAKASFLTSIPAMEKSISQTTLVALDDGLLLAWIEPDYEWVNGVHILRRSPLFAMEAKVNQPSALVSVTDTLGGGGLAVARSPSGGFAFTWIRAATGTSGPEALMLFETDAQLRAIAPATVIDPSYETNSAPDLCGDGGQVALFWINRDSIQRSISGTRLLDAFTLSAPQQIESISASLAGGGMISVWTDGRSPVPAPLLASAAIGNKAGVPIVLRDGDYYMRYPVVASNHSRTFVTWSEYDASTRVAHQRGMILDAGGTPLTDVLTIFSTLVVDGYVSGPPSVVWTGKVFAVIATNVDGRLLIRRYDQDGSSLDAEARPVTAVVRRSQYGVEAPQVYPAAATNGFGALLVWQDGLPITVCNVMCPPPPPAAEIFGVRLDADGFVVDAVPRRITTRPQAMRPSVASNGTRFLVTWIEGGESIVHDTTIAWSIVENLTPIAGMTGTASRGAPTLATPEVAQLGEGFVIAWSEVRRHAVEFYYYTDEPRDIYAAVLDRNGQVISPAFAISAGSDTQSVRNFAVIDGALTLFYERAASASPYTGVFRIFARTIELAGGRARGVRR